MSVPPGAVGESVGLQSLLSHPASCGARLAKITEAVLGNFAYVLTSGLADAGTEADAYACHRASPSGRPSDSPVEDGMTWFVRCLG